MKVSIAMATYNGAQYIGAQLQSFIDQTYQPDEVVITDDCSNDETEVIVQAFAKQAPFKVEFFRNEKNLGYSGNFNAALMKTSGDLVFLSDQDDVWFPEKIEHMLDVAEHHPEALLLMNDAALTDGKLTKVGLTKIGQIRSGGMSMKSFVMGCCCAIRRELLNICLPIPAGFKGHDNWIVDIADVLDAKQVEEKVLQLYRRHELNESNIISNRTTKVKKIHRFADSLNNVFRADNTEKIHESIAQLRLFSNGLERVCELSPAHYRPKLEVLRQKSENKIKTQQSRLFIRQSSFAPRVARTFVFLRKGGYANASGFKSFIRDLIG